MNNIIDNAFKHKNGATRYTHIKVGRNKSYFTNDRLTLFDMGFFEPSVMGGGGGGGMRAPHHNFVVIAPMIMKFTTGAKLDVFYTMVTKKLVTSLLLLHYDVITFILANT